MCEKNVKTPLNNYYKYFTQNCCFKPNKRYHFIT